MIHSFLRLPKCYLLGYQYNLKFSYMCLIFFGTVWIPFFLFRVSPVEFGRGENILYTRKLNISSRNLIFLKKKRDKKKIQGRMEITHVPFAARSRTPNRLLLPPLLLTFERIKIEKRKITSAYMQNLIRYF